MCLNAREEERGRYLMMTQTRRADEEQKKKILAERQAESELKPMSRYRKHMKEEGMSRETRNHFTSLLLWSYMP